MSTWLHLRQDIMWEFYEQGLLGKQNTRPRNLEAWLCAREEMERRSGSERYRTAKSFPLRVRRIRRRQAERSRLLAAGQMRCAWCDVELPAAKRGSVRRVFCGELCRARLKAEIDRARRALATRYALSVKRCGECGGPIAGRMARSVYCSVQCRTLHNTKVRREQRAAARTEAA